APTGRDGISLYRAGRTRRARAGPALCAAAGRGRGTDTRRGEPPRAAATKPTAVSSPQDVAALVGMIATGAVRPPQVHAVGEPRYLVTLWVADRTTLGRGDFPQTSELQGGGAVPPAFPRIPARHLRPTARFIS